MSYNHVTVTFHFEAVYCNEREAKGVYCQGPAVDSAGQTDGSDELHRAVVRCRLR
jgi:hypothetical protein